MPKVAIAKKMEHTQLMLAKLRKVKAKKVKTAAVKGRRVLRKGSRKVKKVGKKHKALLKVACFGKVFGRGKKEGKKLEKEWWEGRGLEASSGASYLERIAKEEKEQEEKEEIKKEKARARKQKERQGV